MLAGLPGGHTADVVADALADAIATLPEQLRRSITWDQGKEMTLHAEITAAAGIGIYFCDPHSPWQRGSSENTYWCRMSGAGFLRREKLGRGRWVTRRTRAERLSVDMSTAARRARALTGSDLIEAC
jgi:IS30 family transposase